MIERRLDTDSRIRALELEHAKLKTRFDDYIANASVTKKSEGETSTHIFSNVTTVAVVIAAIGTFFWNILGGKKQ